MEKKLLEEKIINSILEMHNYLKMQVYYEDINSYALYTDDGFMSMSFIFNTNSYLNRKKKDKYYLTYKYNPAEWFSETLKNDPIIYKNVYFNQISHLLRERALSNHDNEKMLIECCISALKELKNNAYLGKDKLLLFMVSECFNEEDIFKWNSQLNATEIIEEIKLWTKNG